MMAVKLYINELNTMLVAYRTTLVKIALNVELFLGKR